MTAEQLHDALTLLPADLVAEADRRRSGRPKVLRRKRYAAMAACFLLVFCGGMLVHSTLGMGGKTAYMSEEAALPETMAAAPQAAEPESAAQEDSPDQIAPKEDAPLCTLPAAVPDAENNPAETVTENSSVTTATGGFAIRYVQTPRKKNSTASFASDPRICLLQSRTELDAYLERYDWQYDFGRLMSECERLDEAWFVSQDLLLLSIHSVPPEEGCQVNTIQETDGIWEIGMGTSLRLEEPIAQRTDWHILIETEKGQIPDAASVMLIFE